MNYLNFTNGPETAERKDLKLPNAEDCYKVTKGPCCKS